MRPQETFLAQPIRDLQTMLRVIAKHRGEPLPLIPDGIYGAATMKQVSDFQKRRGLPPTGAADQLTWEAILEEFIPAKVNLRPAEPLHILMNAGIAVKKGDKDPNVFLIQAMLEVLNQRYTSVKSPGFSGILDDRTEASIRSFQILSGLSVTGKLDKLTWKNLALQYPLAASSAAPLQEDTP